MSFAISWDKAIIIAVLVVLYGILWFRTKKIKDIERLRFTIAKDLHDEVGSNLSTIGLLGKGLSRQNHMTEAEKEQVQTITRIARETSETMRDIVWFIQPEHDSNTDFVLKMKEAAVSMLADLAFDFQCPPVLHVLPDDLSIRKNIFLLYKEALHNIQKHSRARHVEIDITEEHNKFTLRISDDGTGFDTGTQYSGTGLRSMRHRAETLHGTLNIVSGKQEGTTVEFIFKIPHMWYGISRSKALS